jgi:molybdenum cofactor cytidylyltransferase
LLFGASAIVDRGDVVPAGLMQAGGEVLHLGMPVDPGNLLMLGNLNGKPVVGVPSCARSPKTNGFDWVLQRLMTGEKISAADVMAMGVGGLLAEIPTRPSPREKQASVPMASQISAVVLAAGKSTRMGSNKLLANVRGMPLIRQTVLRVLETSVAEVIVVTGHQADLVRVALEGLAVKFIHNDQYADGLSTSVRVGVQNVSENSDAAVVCLGDMPLVKARDIDRMIAAFSPADQRFVVVPEYLGQWGNPVLWGRDYFAGLCALDGDRGARKLLEELSHELVEIKVENDGVIIDIDTPEALMSLTNNPLR